MIIDPLQHYRLSLPQRRGLQLKASAVGRPQESDGLNEVERQKRKQKLWYLAIKPPMYSVCIIPVLVSFIYNINLPEDKSAIYILVCLIVLLSSNIFV